MTRATFGSVVVALTLTHTPASAHTSQGISDEEAYAVAKEAYVYAYPLVLMDVRFQQLTNFAEPTGIPGQALFNRFSHASAFPPADFKAAVRANVDTLYSVANLDLGPEPLVLLVPTVDRYFLRQMMSVWTDVFTAPGTRTTGNQARNFLLVDPDWQGQVPAGLARKVAATSPHGRVIGHNCWRGG
jgi:hypothetical protein